MTETKEFDLGNFPKEDFDDEVIKDLLGTIEEIEKRGWTGKGWSSGSRVCILNAASAAVTGRPEGTFSSLSGKLLGYIHKARVDGANLSKSTADEINAVMESEDTGYTPTRARIAGDIMHWNDHSGFKRREPIIKTLRNAIDLRKEDLKK